MSARCMGRRWPDPCGRRVTGWEISPDLGAVAGALHELEGLEHRLVVLVFVLHDHVIDEAVLQEWIVAVEVRVLERV